MVERPSQGGKASDLQRVQDLNPRGGIPI